MRSDCRQALPLLLAFLMVAPALGADVARIERARMNGLDLVAGEQNVCALYESDLKCWGDASHGQLRIPALRHPRQVTVGWSHLCALEDRGVICWGDYSQYQRQVPPLREPVALTAGWFHTCALDTTGVHCWGDNSVGELLVPPLSHPRAIAAGGYRTCALDDTGVKCWGDGFDSATVPPLSHPREIAVGVANACVLDDRGAQCWGENFHNQLDAPKLSQPRSLVAGGGHYCALDGAAVKCWGDDAVHQRELPPISEPRAVAAGSTATCVLSSADVRCWGAPSDGLLDIPTDVTDGAAFGTVGGPFLLRNVDRALPAVAKLVYGYKRDFLKKSLADLAELGVAHADTPRARLFLLGALEPVIEDTHSRVLQERVVPRWKAAVREGYGRAGVSGLSQLALEKETLWLALRLSAHALEASRRFVGSPAERRELEQTLLKLARQLALLSPTAPPAAEQTAEIRRLFARHAPLFGTFAQSRRTRGFGLMLLTISRALPEPAGGTSR